MNKESLNFKKIIPPILHILFCAVVLLLPLLVMSKSEGIDYRFYSGYIVRTAGFIFIFYINYLLLIDKLLFNKKFFLYFLVNIALVLGIVALQNVLVEFIWTNFSMGQRPPRFRNPGMPKPPPMIMRMLGEYMSMVFFVGMSVALKATLRWHKDSRNLDKIKATQLEADLRNLRSQLNPHFLFNTLNNIYSLVALDSQKAQDSIHRLSGLLRFVLYENDSKFVPIKKELEFTKNYIDLMALRLSPNVKLDVLIQNEDCNNEIASLMFITLIENAFKHGINNNKPSFININIFVNKDGGVLCTVENSLNDEKDKIESKNSGIGLTNLQKRLNLLYPEKHQFEIEQKADSFSVLLRIDF